jgi:hypothetical protein
MGGFGVARDIERRRQARQNINSLSSAQNPYVATTNKTLSAATELLLQTQNPSPYGDRFVIRRSKVGSP